MTETTKKTKTTTAGLTRTAPNGIERDNYDTDNDDRGSGGGYDGGGNLLK